MRRSPDQNQRDEVKLILHEALGDEYRNLLFDGLVTQTHSKTKETGVTVRFTDNGTSQEAVVCNGKGAVDGIYKALKKHYSHLSSIKNLTLKSIDVNFDLPNSKTGTDAMVKVSICFCNDKQCAYFTDTSYSFTRSACECLLRGVQFFLNSELAFKKIKGFVKDAKKRNRYDLVSKYQMQLATIVNTNIAEYQEVE